MSESGRDDITVTICGDARSGASTSMRALISCAVVALGADIKTDGRLVSAYDLHGSHIIVQQRARRERKKNRVRK